jgi:hypothetical protein
MMILFDLAVLQAKTKMWKINNDIQRTRSDTGTLLPGKVGTDLKIPVVNIKLHLCILRDAVIKKDTRPMVLSDIVEIITSRVLLSPSWIG